MLFDYARPSKPQCRRGLAIIAAAVSLLCGTFAFLCTVQTMHVVTGMQQAGNSFCGNCYQAMVAALGMPPEQAIPFGVLSAGFALAAGIQAIRFVNSAGHR